MTTGKLAELIQGPVQSGTCDESGCHLAPEVLVGESAELELCSGHAAQLVTELLEMDKVRSQFAMLGFAVPVFNLRELDLLVTIAGSAKGHAAASLRRKLQVWYQLVHRPGS